jgi:Fur family ferric uptake transcriptional regulator
MLPSFDSLSETRTQSRNASMIPPMERTTRQRQAIREALQQADRPLLASEVLEQAKLAVPSLGIATVYRTLKTLVAEESLQIVALPGENPRFEFAHGHHHHFCCKACKRVFDVHACPGDLSRLVPKGFSISNHELTLYGKCPDCA